MATSDAPGKVINCKSHNEYAGLGLYFLPCSLPIITLRQIEQGETHPN